MLATNSILLKGNENFQTAFEQIEDRETEVRFLQTADGEETNIYQIYNPEKQIWQGPRTMNKNKKGEILPLNLNSKSKLENTKLLYNTFTKPTHAGSTDQLSWLIGDIQNCDILNEDYSVQGLIVTSIFDPTPKYYISFKRLVCENQFGSLGTSNSSLYLNMNKFLISPTAEIDDNINIDLNAIINNAIEERNAITIETLEKLRKIKLPKTKAISMFEKLTIDKVAKENEMYKHAEEKLQRYTDAYNCNDNQNYKGTFLGFVNSCTNFNSRNIENPIEVIKPVIDKKVLDSPLNLDYLMRDILVNAKSA